MSHLTDTSRRRDRLATVVHYLTAFVLVMEGISHLEHEPKPWPFISLCWVSALAVVLVTSAHHRIEPHFPQLQSVIHFAEGAVASALAYLTHHEGKVRLPYVWALAAAMFLALAAWEFRRSSRHPEAPQTTPIPEEGTGGDA